MNLQEAREQFPHLKTDQVYFNHAAIGPWSNLAVQRINEYVRQRSGEKIENYQSVLKWNSSAKEKLGSLIGAESERIAWVDSVSNGINILAQGIDWKQGDRIILNDLEFPSNVYPFLNLKKYGVEIDFVKSVNGTVTVDEIEKLISPKTKLISISLVQFLSGYRADVDSIGQLCRKHGIIFSVDAIQAAGVVEIDVKKSNIDFLTGGTQKWLMSSQGLSYIYLTEELQKRIDQKNVGWTSVENAWDLLKYDLTLKKDASRFQSGTVNWLGVSVFDAVLDLFTGFGIANIEKTVLSNTEFFIDLLSSIGIESLLLNVEEKKRAGIVSFKHKKSKDVFDMLEEKKIFAAMREGMIRFSPHFYNSKEEIERVVSELKIILEKV